MTNAEMLDLRKMDIRHLEKMKKLVKEFYVAFGQKNIWTRKYIEQQALSG